MSQMKEFAFSLWCEVSKRKNRDCIQWQWESPRLKCVIYANEFIARLLRGCWAPSKDFWLFDGTTENLEIVYIYGHIHLCGYMYEDSRDLVLLSRHVPTIVSSTTLRDESLAWSKCRFGWHSKVTNYRNTWRKLWMMIIWESKICHGFN